MGAMYRHTQSPHALWTHVGFSIVVVILAVIGGATLMGRRRLEGLSPTVRQLNHRLYWVGHLTMIVVTLQFLIGWAVLFTVLSTDPAKKAIPTADQLTTAAPIEPYQALLRTAHQANGAALLALATLGAVWIVRLSIRSRSAVSATPTTA
jgi:hypothetical protein